MGEQAPLGQLRDQTDLVGVQSPERTVTIPEIKVHGPCTLELPDCGREGRAGGLDDWTKVGRQTKHSRQLQRDLRRVSSLEWRKSLFLNTAGDLESADMINTMNSEEGKQLPEPDMRGSHADICPERIVHSYSVDSLVAESTTHERQEDNLPSWTGRTCAELAPKVNRYEQAMENVISASASPYNLGDQDANYDNIFSSDTGLGVYLASNDHFQQASPFTTMPSHSWTGLSYLTAQSDVSWVSRGTPGTQGLFEVTDPMVCLPTHGDEGLSCTRSLKIPLSEGVYRFGRIANGKDCLGGFAGVPEEGSYPKDEVGSMVSTQKIRNDRLGYHETSGAARKQNPETLTSSSGVIKPQLKKRSRKDDEEVDGNPGETVEKQHSLDPEDLEATAKQKFLACPYFRYNSVKHLKCFRRFQLKRVKDVKQHLYRKHSQPLYYCPRCWVTFIAPVQRDNHINSQTCHKKDRPVFEGISDGQKSQLNQRPSSGSGEENQWFQVWDILFPGMERPPTAYLGNEIEEVVSTVRMFWNDNRSSIVSKVLSCESMRAGQATAGGNSMEDSERVTSVMETLLSEFESKSKKAPVNEVSAGDVGPAPGASTVSPGLLSLPFARNSRSLSNASEESTFSFTPPSPLISVGSDANVSSLLPEMETKAPQTPISRLDVVRILDDTSQNIGSDYLMELFEAEDTVIEMDNSIKGP